MKKKYNILQAGIPDNLLSLALEPEAASLFCKSHFKDLTMTSGTRYLVLDLGGECRENISTHVFRLHILSQL